MARRIPDYKRTIRLQVSPSNNFKHKLDTFEYNPHPARVVFGSGTLQKLPDDITRLQMKAPLVLSSPLQTGQAEK